MDNQDENCSNSCANQKHQTYLDEYHNDCFNAFCTKRSCNGKFPPSDMNIEKIKEYDVFISHNSNDENKIVEFYKKLNQNGYVAYIDWVNDKFDLKRQWCNASTAQVIKERIRQSKVFIVFLSRSTLKSQWCPWELGYADALGKKICVYLYDSEKICIPQFYEGYPKVYFDDKIWIEEGERIEFENWITFKR